MKKLFIILLTLCVYSIALCQLTLPFSDYSTGAKSEIVKLKATVISAGIRMWNFGLDPVKFPVYAGVPANNSVTIDGLTITAGSVATNMGQIEPYSTSYNGINYVNRFKFNGAGWSGANAGIIVPSVYMPTQRYVSFAVAGKCRIIARGITGSNAEARRLFVTDGTKLIGTMIFPVVTIAGTVTENIVVYEGEATTLFMYCNASVNLFYLSVEDIQDPLIEVSTNSVTNMNYTYGKGPSSIQSFTVNGKNLTGNIEILNALNFELSKTSEDEFSPLSSFVLTNNQGVVSNSMVYVRLKSGLPVGVYSENIQIKSNGAVSAEVVLSGTVVKQDDLNPVRTVNIETPGNLIAFFTENEKSLITHLTVTGNINWEEIGSIKQHLPVLKVLDLSGVNVDGNVVPFNQFYNNSTLILDSIVLPSGLTSIRSNAFRNCTGIKSVVIGNALTSIETSAFEGCTGLTEIALGSAVTNIMGSAFRNCIELKNIVIGNSVTSLGNNAFFGCSGLKRITIGNGIASIGPGTFIHCTQLNEVVIPNSVTLINNNAFYGCSGITKLTLGASLTTLGVAAFGNSNNIKTIICLANNPPVLGAGSFNFDIYSKANVIVPTNKITVYKENFGWDQFLNYYEPGIASSTPNIYGLINTPNSGPSKIRSFKVSAVLLTNDLTITAPANFEISTKAGAEFMPANEIIISPIDGMVADTTLYVRLKSGLSINTYNENIEVASAGFTKLNIALNGAVRNTPDTIHVNEAGTMSSLFTDTEKAAISKLVITGNIDARDMNCLRDEMPLLADLNMRNVMIKSYYGLDGTNETILSYPENVFPQNSFFNYKNNLSKTSLRSIILPTSITSIGHRAFYNCTALTKIVSLIATPPSLAEGSETLMGVPSSCSLRVPIGSVSTYKSVLGWSSFNVEEYKLKVETKTTGNVQQTSAVLNGSIDIIADFPVLSHGFCWNTNANPTISDAKTERGSKLTEGYFNDTISNLVYGTTYYVRAYATDETGTVYGSETSFYTPLPDHIKIIHLETPGTLGGLISSADRDVVTDLTLTGNIDVRDFKFMRDGITGLTRLNLMQSTIIAYTGAGGTCNDSVVCTYPANEVPVYALGYNYLAAVPGNSSLTTVKLPVNAKSIGKGAFSGCFDLTDVTLSSGLKNIGNQAFVGCGNLKSLVLPSKVSEIGNYAFAGCGFSSFIIPDSVTSIGAGAFSGCLSLDSIIIPDLISEIAGYTFAGCKNLQEIILPVSVVRIGERAFEDCDKLTDIRFCANVNEIAKGAFSKCDGFMDLVIPNSVTSIGDNAFEQCNGIKSVTLGSSLNSIGELVFMDSFGLNEFIVHPDNATFTASEAVLFDKNLTILIDYPFDKHGDYTIPSTVNSLGNYAFLMARNLKNVIIPVSVRNIGFAAFAHCLSLESITCKSEVPIDLSSSEFVFAGVSKNACKLIVPAGAGSAYQSANQWSEFVNIVEHITTGFERENNIATKVLYDSSAGCLRVCGMMETTLLEIFNLSGRLVLNAPVNEGLSSINISNLSDGVYFYRINHMDKVITGRFIKN
jgi:hypothetical protein